MDQARHARKNSQKDQVAILSDTTLPTDYSDEGWVPLDRLRRLLTDAQWVEFATHSLDHDLDLNRDIVGNWAAVMIGADEPKMYLDKFAGLNDEIFALQQILRVITWEYKHNKRPAISDALIDAALRQWQVLDGKARIISNHLWAVAGEPEHSIAIPTWRGSAKGFAQMFDGKSVLYPLPDSTAEWQVRSWRSADLRQIQQHILPVAKRIFAESGASSREISNWAASHLTERHLGRFIKSSSGLTILAYNGAGSILGTGALAVEGTTAEVTHLYVSDSREGIGSDLLGRLLLAGVAKGVDTFTLLTTASNFGMLALASRYGFDQDATVQGTRNFEKLVFTRLTIDGMSVLPYPELAQFIRPVLFTGA